MEKELQINDRLLTIHSDGKVFYQGKEMRQNVNTDGYLVVYAGNNRSIGVHRLVAMAFIHNDDPIKKTEVNHKDFNRQNNDYRNLEWLSHRDNVKYSHKHNRYKGLFGEENPNYGNRKLSQYYKENPEISKIKQSRKGERNGKARKIELYKDGNFLGEFNYIGACAKFLIEEYGLNTTEDAIRTGINRSIKKNTTYHGCFTFIKK